MAAMAVTTGNLYHATDALILSKPRKHYRATIETSHWQLRSLISSPEPNIVYYPAGSDIISLNTKTREREIIAKVSFFPKCLAASKDWLCCGGDKGQYSVIALKGGRGVATASALTNWEADPDERLPLDLDPALRSIARDTSETRPHPPVVPVVLTRGTEIVNCVTLWTPGDISSARAYDIPVAVVANNDCSISILDVRDSKEIEKLTLPDFANRSLLSPEGDLLVTICDDPYLYVHERRQKAGFSEGKGRFNDKDMQRFEWVMAQRIQLEGQRKCDGSENRGSFASCFSPSGRYLAVATQYGVISVFNSQSLTGSDSLPIIFTSSRPGVGNGAVRSIEFSPEPFELLAWTEHSGRIGVADVRTLFQSRQIIKIDSQADGVERVSISERSSDTSIDPRLLGESAPSHNSTPDYLGLDLERRELRHLTREMMDRNHNPITAEELDVLQRHRIARRQRDAADTAREVFEGSNRWSSRADGPRSVTTITGEGPGSTNRRISTSGLPAALREFVNPDRPASAFRSFINERNLENERRNQLQQEPSSRSSTILAAVESTIERETLGRSTSRTANDTSSTLERLTLTSSRVEPFGSDSPNNPWAEIDALYHSRFPGDPGIDRSTRLRVEVAADEEPRDFAHRLRMPWRPLDELGSGNPSRPVESMGCTWSSDGRKLYVGARDGIHEYWVNISARRKFPSIVMR